MQTKGESEKTVNSLFESGILNECKSKTQHEFSERDKEREGEGRIYMEEIKQYRHENKYHITYAQYLSLRQRLRTVMKPDPHTRQDRKCGERIHSCSELRE